MAVERIRTLVVHDHDELGRLVARRIAELVRARKAAAGGSAVLGLATGSTPIGVYRELIRMHREEGLSFARVVTFNLDEYYPMDPESIHSYHRFMWENLFSHSTSSRENVHIPRGDVPRDEVEDDCRRYEEAIARRRRHRPPDPRHRRTGHIGFNEPGSGADSRTRLVTLDPVTRRDAAADFFGEENVPREALTMGVATILEAREIAILATGEHKAAIVAPRRRGRDRPEVAATFLQRHPNTTFYLDRAAARGAHPRSRRRGCSATVEWTPDLDACARSSGSRSRPARRSSSSTQRDYAEHRLSSLVAQYGSPGALNGEVFNALGAKIRGRSKLPQGQRIICFSPHPDDDVISMGGILRKLVENENEIIVAYMTSGNIAVFDHDVRRYVDFLGGSRPSDGIDGDAAAALGRAGGRVPRRASSPGDVDIPEVQDIKRIIRETEAVAGIETLGLTTSAARFLNLPFYQTGKVQKDPIGPGRRRDRARRCSRRSSPTSSSSPAISPIRTAPTGCARRRSTARSPSTCGRRPRPEVWLYRGAWQEWPVTEATWLVPLVAGGAAAQDPGDLQAPVAEGLGARSPGRTSASSGSASRRATRAPPRSSTGSGWRNTSRWRRTSSRG